jgi:hypothetical protein
MVIATIAAERLHVAASRLSVLSSLRLFAIVSVMGRRAVSRSGKA